MKQKYGDFSSPALYVSDIWQVRLNEKQHISHKNSSQNNLFFDIFLRPVRTLLVYNRLLQSEEFDIH